MAMGRALLQNAGARRRCNRKRESRGKWRAREEGEAAAGQGHGADSAWSLPAPGQSARTVGETWPGIRSGDLVRGRRGRPQGPRSAADPSKGGAISVWLFAWPPDKEGSARHREDQTTGMS